MHHNQFQNIPAELQALNQWCLWKYEDIGAAKPTKVPYSVRGQLANVNDPSTFSTFEDVTKAVHNYSGIGFIFTERDPYTFIDLDDTMGDQAAMSSQLKVYHEFNSYAEISPSGKGLHIICKGGVAKGRRRSFIEIYSSQRYATFTGNVYPSVKEVRPIVDCQNLLTQLWEQMGSGPIANQIYNGDDKETASDEEIISTALAAVNGDKFQKLIDGTWNDIYQSQSEADFAFIDIIAFYTQNRNQITRLFRKSVLGQRSKANRTDYIQGMVNKSFDRMLPKIDFDGFKIQIEKKLEEQPLLPMDLPKIARKELTIPPGLMGEIAQFIYNAAPRPVPEIALAASIALMAGVAGRAYNISGTGLNQYVMLIAMTGSGKESAASGIDKLMNAIKLQVPTSKEFLGPSEIASGQALVKHLGKRAVPCFLSILGEFGLRLQSMSNPNANGAEISLKRVLLDLYNKSGHGQNMAGSIYADAEKNTSSIESPAFSILGESTPERFYGALNEDMISEGLLPRFMLIEYTGPRVPLSGQHLTANPPNWLVDKFASLVANCSQIMHAKKVIHVQSNQQATAMFEDFDRYCDRQINTSDKELSRQLWNRAHIKALKIAALIAVGVNMSDPLILPEYVIWAIDMVQSDIRSLSVKFASGEVGTISSEVKQSNEVTKAMIEYLSKDFQALKNYRIKQNLHEAKIIPYAYLSMRMLQINAFKNDRMGATPALQRVIKNMIEGGKIREIGRTELATKYGTSQRAFVISDMSFLD